MKLPIAFSSSRPLRWSCAAALALCLLAVAAASARTAFRPVVATVVPAPLPATAPAAPVVPAAEPATDLSFDEFFHLPIGPRGMEFTDKLQRLNGQRVRITGHMVNHLHANPRVFILSSVPLKFHQCEFGLCDDLPATAIHVHVPGNPRDRVAFAPGELVLTGRLSVGNVEEFDGRISAVRLFLDSAQAATMRTIAASAGTVR